MTTGRATSCWLAGGLGGIVVGLVGGGALAGMGRRRPA